MPHSQHHLALPIFVLIVLVLAPRLATANPALEGYANYEALAARVEALKQKANIRVTSLGQTLGKREIFLITLGTGELDKKPASLIVGDVVPGEVVGSEAVLRMIDQILARADTDEAAKALLQRRTIYFIPRPSPDTAEKCFVKPYREPAGNERKTDDDRDGKKGEDPPEDLNGDGWITVMRITDPTGDLMPHPDDTRVMIKAEPTKNERGQYRLLTEGIDNDHDEAFNEDAGDGVSFNRNFTYNYPAFKTAAGPNQVSEIETRAVADFCFDHPNIAAVWTMTPEDNLLQPWKPDGDKEKNRIKTTILTSDAAYQDFLANLYQKIREANGQPGSLAGEGSFSEWAYFHYGRGSLASRVWWVPPVDVKEGEKKSDEKRGADELNALRYFAANNFEGFVPWDPVEHPDFPDQKVEVGGFKPFYRTHPPAGELDEIVKKQVEFLMQAEALSPKLVLDKLKAEALGGGVVRLSVTVRNEGYLPTMPEMGEVSRHAYPLWIAWTVPEKTVWLQGSARSRLSRLAGQGGHIERTWIVRLPEPPPKELTVLVHAPSVGETSATVEVKPAS